jgi:hypothetical protein
MRPAIKWICPNGCIAHQDRKIAIGKPEFAICRKCGTSSIDAEYQIQNKKGA